MNPYGGHIPAEIAALQKRADQLLVTNGDADVLLAALTTKVEAARSLEDPALALRLERKIRLLGERRARTLNEIDTLLALIAARRTRYGLPAPHRGVGPA